MQREAIIHIGTMKTGSTSIQNVFNKRRDEMLPQGAYYPRTPGLSAHQLLTYVAARPRPATRLPEEGIWNGMDPEERLVQFRGEFAREMEALPDHVDRVIFSDERLSFMLRDVAEITPLREILQPYFSRFRVIAYLRKQDSYLASRYSELLRVGSIGEPDHIRNIPEVIVAYDYSRLLGNWAAVFGQESIKPRLYERGAAKSFDSVDDFIAACGLSIVVPQNDPARGSNPSMNAAGQEVLREVGKVMQERMNTKHVAGPLWRTISNTVTKALPGKGWLPTRDEAAAFMARFADANEDVRSKYFPNQATLFADDQASFPLHASTLTDRQRFEAACAALLEAMTHSVNQEAAAERRAKQARTAADKAPGLAQEPHVTRLAKV
jgi:hypothetical protein